MMRWSFLVVLFMLVSACAGGPGPGRVGPSAEGRGAALARLTVNNQTGERLTIAYRPATGPGAEVVVGRVDAGATASTAPVPAGEPIVLIARRPDGQELRLPPRTFELDAGWSWVIPADSRFRAPEEASS